MEQPESPQVTAMREALKQAEEAAERRRLAKLKEREGALAPDISEEDLAVIEATRVAHEAVEEMEELPPPTETFDLDEPANLSQIMEALDREFPDLNDREVHGDLEIMRHDTQTPAWYDEATEEALPASVRGIPGPMDVKRLLLALIVEVGDVKRTNAILMEMVTRLDEKVERTNRYLRDKSSQ